jgi:N-methylhydantoinase B
MRANVIHSSYSSIIYEGHDFSCGLVAADGRLVAQSLDDNPIHIFAVPYSTAEVVRRFGEDIHDGDIFLHNDPYTGGTHLNDVLMLFPVFHGGRLVLFTAVRCHWGDVGGMTAGSLSGRVREIYQEGIRIVPTRICERGRMNEAFLELLFANMRLSHERRGDFNTMLGTSRKAADHLQRLFKRFGGTGLLKAIDELIDRAERVMRQRIVAVPDGVYFAEGYMDSDGHNSDPLVGRLKLTISGNCIEADFSGSSTQTAGPLNVGPAMAFNAVATMLKAFLDPDTPVNHGSFKPLTIINPQGSFLNATLPAPCGGMVECRALLSALVVSAIGQALPELRVGDLKGGANHVYLSGHRSDGSLFLLYEYPAGGTGASAGHDGHHGVRAYPEGDFNAVWSVEVVEAQCPAEVIRYGIREGSCGDGEFRGGCGIRRDIRILVDGASLSVLADKCVIPPSGTAGGFGGSPNRFVVIRDGRVIAPSPIPGKVGGFELRKGDVVRIETAGGGGYGDPLDRDPVLVLQDVRLGVISSGHAASRYGVVLTAEGDIDPSTTKKQRHQLRAERVMIRPAAGADQYDGARRIFRLPMALAQRASLTDGELFELVSSTSAFALRGWAQLDETHEALALGPAAAAVLGYAGSREIELRPLRSLEVDQ